MTENELLADVAQYETWLRGQCAVVEEGLVRKHKENMRDSPLAFLRATYFRWAKRVDLFAPECLEDPQVLAVGDCHIENFGTWRDADARAVWGVNDFDDASEMPYSLDLIRLCTSVVLSQELDVPLETVCAQILAGYGKGLERPGPVLLDDGNKWLRTVLHGLSDKVGDFWDDIDRAEPAHVPPDTMALLKASMPAAAAPTRMAAWQRGGGSLGRPRFVVVADWQGGRVVREAKALVPSSWAWARHPGDDRIRFIDLSSGRFRSPDPALSVSGRVIVRRLAADSRKLSAKQLSASGRLEDVLKGMGREIGAIHAAHAGAHAVQGHLSGRHPGWLLDATARAVQFVQDDFAAWSAP